MNEPCWAKNGLNAYAESEFTCRTAHLQSDPSLCCPFSEQPISTGRVMISGMGMQDILGVLSPPHNSGRVLWFYNARPCVHLSSILFFWKITCKFQWIFTILGKCIDIVKI